MATITTKIEKTMIATKVRLNTLQHLQFGLFNFPLFSTSLPFAVWFYFLFFNSKTIQL